MIIRIRRDTVRPNPKGGQSTFHRTTGPQERTTVLLVPVYSSGDGTRRRSGWEEHTLVNDVLVSLRVVPASLEPFVHTSNRQPTNALHTLQPTPLWLFEYEDPTIRCFDCHREVKISQLKTEYEDNGGEYDAYSEVICPFCNSWDTLGNYEKPVWEKLDDHSLEKIWRENERRRESGEAAGR